MLINFIVKNYKSFYNENNLNLSLNIDSTHSERVEENISKSMIVYGEKDSGKTSFVEAVTFVRMFALMSNYLDEKTPIGLVPNNSPNNSSENTTDFSFIFEKNNIKYEYSFSSTIEKVINEKLDIINSSNITNIFKRTNTTEFVFNEDEKLLNNVKKCNKKNQLFLLSAWDCGYEKVDTVVDYIINDIIYFYHTNQSLKYNLQDVYLKNDIDEYNEFCLNLLKIEDESIIGLKIEENNFEIMKNLFDKLYKNNVYNKTENRKKDGYSIIVKHIDNNDEKREYTLNLTEEPTSIKQICFFAPALYYVIKEGKTLFVDDADKNFSTKILKHLIRLFNNKELNKNNAQLICFTQDENLLNIDILKKDEVLLIKKDNDTGFSNLYRVDNFL